MQESAGGKYVFILNVDAIFVTEKLLTVDLANKSVITVRMQLSSMSSHLFPLHMAFFFPF